MLMSRYLPGHVARLLQLQRQKSKLHLWHCTSRMYLPNKMMIQWRHGRPM